MAMNTPKVEALVHASAEMAVLAGLVGPNVETAIELSRQIDPLDFSTPFGQVISEAAIRILRGYEPMDAKALLAACRDIAAERKLKIVVSEPQIAGVMEGDSSRSVAYAATVKRYAWLRRAHEFASWFGAEVLNISDPDELFAGAQERIQHLQPAQRASKFIYGWDTIKEHDGALRERIREFEAGTAIRYDWPWRSWNELVRPLRSGMVGVVAAPDGVGKSTILEMVAEHWAGQGSHVVFVHLENDFDYTMNRRLCRWSHVPIAAIEDGNLTPAQRNAISDAYQRMNLDTLHYYDASGLTMAELVAELSIRRSENVLDAVVIDYLNKVRPSRDQARLFGANPFERQADDMELLKSWAVGHGVPAFTAVQMNKEGQDNRRQTRQNIRGTGQLSEKSQLVVVLTRDILDADMTDGRNVIARAGEYSPLMHVRVDKQNRGRTGEFDMVYVGKQFEVHDVQAR